MSLDLPLHYSQTLSLRCLTMSQHSFRSCEPLSLQFRHPSCTVIAGPSQSGKTTFLSSLIASRERMFAPPVGRVIYCYGQYQSAFDAMSNVEFVQGPDYERLLDPSVPTLLVLDDLMSHPSLELVKLFTVTAHHSNVSVFFVVHNIFYPHPSFRTAMLNTQYVLLFRSVRGLSQVTALARQIAPSGSGRARRIVEAYQDATATPYTYLLIDLHPQTPDYLRLRAEILPGEGDEAYGCRLSTAYKY